MQSTQSLANTVSQFRKRRPLLPNPRQHRLPRILTLQHSRIPNTRIPQPLLHPPIPPPIQNLLRPHHRNRTLPRHDPRPPHRLPHHLPLPPLPPNPTHKPHPPRLLGPKNPPAETNILHPTPTPHNLRQPTQRPDIRREPNVNLFDRKPRLSRTNPHIAAHGDIDAEPQTPTMYSRHDRLLTLFYTGDTSLERIDVPTQPGGGSRAVEGSGMSGGVVVVGGGVWGDEGVCGCFSEVEARCEGLVAGAGEDDGAGGGGGREVGEEGGEFVPHSVFGC